jgi:hypothetical protein
MIRPIITVAALEDYIEYVQDGSKSFNWLVRCALPGSKAWTVFARAAAETVSSNPTQGMDV